jgi:predicted house-cleaning noncanonical NTP pyrophosphatase (MazG superfamily)
MAEFILKKIGRDKGVEAFRSQSITPNYKHLQGKELVAELQKKLIEEAYEVQEAQDAQEMIGELADVLEVIDGLYKAYGISPEAVAQEKEKRRQERGGFATGLYIETIQMSEDNPRVKHFRKSPKKYPEI